MSASLTVHGTSVALSGRAILIRGQPGSGKSTLALELLECPGNGLNKDFLQAQLIADDQTIITSGPGKLWCSCPPKLSGLLEVRGLGIISLSAAGPAPLSLVVDLMPEAEAPRLPEDGHKTAEILGVAVPRLLLAAEGRGLASRVRTAFVRL